MINEYIRRAEALEITTRTCGDYAAAFAEIRKLPAADVAEVVHARWLTDKWTKWPHRECTRCRIFIPVTVEVPDPYWQYCPNCGAKMDGGENDVSG